MPPIRQQRHGVVVVACGDLQHHHGQRQQRGEFGISFCQRAAVIENMGVLSGSKCRWLLGCLY